MCKDVSCRLYRKTDHFYIDSDNCIDLGAGVDVFQNEPPKKSYVMGGRNISISTIPHIGASTHESLIRISICWCHKSDHLCTRRR